MKLTQIETKGLTKCLAAAGMVPNPLRLHISTVPPGQRSHEAHTHSGVEVFYILDGEATVEVQDEQYPLGANEAAVIDASVPHGIFNRGAAPTRYLVIIAA